ncbi:MAG: DUF4167 domain-containing protein [Amphiplicatus sp.]
MKRGRNQRRRQGMNINRALDSNGPDVRIRGTANQIYDKYLALARDASSSGDRVKAENYLQHAEHYFRVIRAIQPAQAPQGDGVDADGEQPTIGGESAERWRRSEQSGGSASETAEGEEEAEAEPPPPRPRDSHAHGNSAGDLNGARRGGGPAAPEGGPPEREGGERRGRRRRPRRHAQDDGSPAEPGAEERAEPESA